MQARKNAEGFKVRTNREVCTFNACDVTPTNPIPRRIACMGPTQHNTTHRCGSSCSTTRARTCSARTSTRRMCTVSTRGTSSSTGWSPVRAPPECPHACTRPPACPVDPLIIVDGTAIHPQTHHMSPPSNRHPRLPRARHGSARRRRGHSAHHSAARSARHRGARHGARGAYAPWLGRACV